ncbi:MAG: NAD(+) kinase [Candidatus Wallbacteria bacterium HGW-Wallbacteria-1]|jgi:NAD+ kinase|uniref:NAD kinase n=1 Tax=Candidatus Wallbacteria bacterium HGW-Wallbacteria-1 TaxID=2013854 RepID=A0A2N1PTT5_9BACT|nr:MAG: NAD(+) kinase [Candidatus Wallbacteria bacterium HGW-Wallbacteria-1]
MVRNSESITLEKGSSIGLLFNAQKIEACLEASRVSSFLSQRGYRLVVPSGQPGISGDAPVVEVDDLSFGSDLALVVVFGGDGTILSTARRLCGHGTPILGVNTGTVGFLAEIIPSEFCDVILRLESGQAIIDRRMMMEVAVLCPGKPDQRDEFVALNDAVINRESFARILDLDLCVDGMEVDSYHGDGVIVSTPTGSTGYSLSAGGPIVHPGIDVMTVTPICVHRLHARSMVVSSDQIIEVSFPRSALEARLTIDGQVYRTLEGCERITMTRSSMVTRLITFPEKNFYRVLHAKLSGEAGRTARI